MLLDGAQGAGAVPVDVDALGCAFYAGAGQKWLCGPVGTGMLWVAPAWHDRLAAAGPTYLNLDEPGAGLDAAPRRDARRHDASAIAPEAQRRSPSPPTTSSPTPGGTRSTPAPPRWPPRWRGRWPSAAATVAARGATHARRLGGARPRRRASRASPRPA